MDIYQIFHPRLEKYYPLVSSLLEGDLSIEFLESFFKPEIAKEIMHLNEKFFCSNSTRSCGNPGFVHSLRTMIWIVALGGNEETKLLALYHDILEDFGKSSEDLEKEFSQIPNSIASDCLALTNRHSLLIKELEKIPKQQEHLDSLSSSEILADVAKETSKDLPKRTLVDLKRDSYEKYLQLLKDVIYETGNERILMVKLADRLDNTLADWPSKFRSLVKIYSKNSMTLEAYKDLVLNGFASAQTKLLYIMLIERSLNQIRFLITNYGVLVEKRGLFYGQQYQKLKDILLEEQYKLLPFESVKSELLSQESLQKFLEQFKIN